MTIIIKKIIAIAVISCLSLSADIIETTTTELLLRTHILGLEKIQRERILNYTKSLKYRYLYEKVLVHKTGTLKAATSLHTIPKNPKPHDTITTKEPK